MLSEMEKKILKELKKVKKATAEELAKKIKTNIDGVKRTAYFLSKKGYVRLIEKKGESLRLTEKGERALKEGFEEERIKEGEVSKLPENIKRVLWILRESGFVEIDKGRIKLKGKEYVLRKILRLIKGGKKIPMELEKYLSYLIKEGFVEKEKEESYVVEITEKGEKEEVEEEEKIGRLSMELLVKKNWKGKEFREFEIPSKISPVKSGKLHPFSLAIRKIKDVFLSLGFEEMKGNYVESSFWVFDALFQPQDHPSRELADTFYLEGETEEKLDKELVKNVKEQHERFWKYKWSFEEAKRLVLRTHTTALSARTLYERKRGKFFAIGRVFRNEAVDYKHLAEFHQIEGIVGWEKANFSNLLWLLKEFFSRLGFKKIRFRPSYFPYTEPSLEIEAYFEKRKEWVEVGGAGVFRKQVSDGLGAEYPVLAWGLSLERPLMLMLGIDDIREYYINKKRWLDSISYKSIF